MTGGGWSPLRSVFAGAGWRADMDAPGKLFAVVGWSTLVGITLLFLVVLVRVAQLQTSPSTALAAHIDDRVMRRSEIAPRGDLQDRRGRLLAGTRVGRRVFVDPTQFRAPYGDAVLTLAGAVGLPPDIVGTRILSRIEENQRRAAEDRTLIRYVSIGGVLDPGRLDAVEKLKLPGVHLERRSVRESPAGPVAAAWVGKVGVDHNGLLGAEIAFDEELKPANGELEFVHDARGRALWIEAGGYVAPRRGEDLRLSVDLAIQQIAADELERGVEEADAAGGRAVVLDPATGEILAMCDVIRDVPGLLKPRQRSAGRQPAEDIEPGARYAVIRPDPGRRIHPALGRNRCVEDAYEPGSTFKPFMWSTVTRLGLAKPDEVFDTEGGRWRTPYGRPLADVVHKDSQSWMEVLINSSNIGMVKGVSRLTEQQARDAIVSLGFGRRTGIDLPGESAGMVTSQQHWSKYTQTSVSMGYEVAVTPVQMVRGFSAFARNGRLAGTLPELRVTAIGPEEADGSLRVTRVIPDWTALLAREAMRHVGENLDARLIAGKKVDAPPKYDMFGKSGTANVARPDGHGYFREQYRSSFIAGAPFENPRIVVLVVMDDPGPERVRARTHYGSAVAGPVVRRVVERVLGYMGVPPTMQTEKPLAARPALHD